jgi:hypothetical protein
MRIDDGSGAAGSGAAGAGDGAGDDVELDPATVAVLAHGLLNGLSALHVSLRVLFDTHPDRGLVERLSAVVDPQVDLMTDSLRLLARGLPDDVLDLLSRPAT